MDVLDLYIYFREVKMVMKNVLLEIFWLDQPCICVRFNLNGQNTYPDVVYDVSKVQYCEVLLDRGSKFHEFVSERAIPTWSWFSALLCTLLTI